MKRSLTLVALTIQAAVLCALAVNAADMPAKQPLKEIKPDDVRVMLAAKVPGAKPEDVLPTPVAGLYEISLGGNVGYITADGKFMLTGELYEIDTKTNVTEVRRTAVRVKELVRIPDSDTIVFSPVGQVKHTVTVFTDVDCGYCRKLHSEMAEYNKLGIRVRYAAYPRQGPGSEAWSKMESVWCAKDRKEAMTHAKQGEEPKVAKCATPVASQYALGEKMGVNGTPAIITSNGDYIAGYMPPAKLLAQLEEFQKDTQSSAAAKAKAGT